MKSLSKDIAGLDCAPQVTSPQPDKLPTLLWKPASTPHYGTRSRWKFSCGTQTALGFMRYMTKSASCSGTTSTISLVCAPSSRLGRRPLSPESAQGKRHLSLNKIAPRFCPGYIKSHLSRSLQEQHLTFPWRQTTRLCRQR